MEFVSLVWLTPTHLPELLCARELERITETLERTRLLWPKVIWTALATHINMEFGVGGI